MRSLPENSATKRPGWASFAAFNANVDVPGSLAAPGQALDYPWKHFIGGHLGRLGTRADLTLHLGAADVFVTSTVFVILESLRLDLGEGLFLHP